MEAVSLERRLLVMAGLLYAFAVPAAGAAPIDRHETFVLQPDQIRFQPWSNLPPGSGEMASLYGDLNKPGPYLVMMKWHPGWYSAPHNYRTDRIPFRRAGLSCATPALGITAVSRPTDMSRW
jgi:hypothetical protein